MEVKAAAQVLAQLGKIGSNINQLAHYAHLGRFQSDSIEMALRDLAAAAVGDDYVALLELLAIQRVIGDGGADLHDRPDWQAIEDSGTLDLIRAGQLAEAKERLQAQFNF